MAIDVSVIRRKALRRVIMGLFLLLIGLLWLGAELGLIRLTPALACSVFFIGMGLALLVIGFVEMKQR
ncbi:MAG: hypothetical protein DRJ32_07180 [Thermoprotei archaeon]|nr:MAG: hypothetical protein DRJ32_07180 [Thermoprotei archaeon]